MTSTDRIELPVRFRIDQEIGHGGMAVVYRAHDRHLDRGLAVDPRYARLLRAAVLEDLM